MPDKKDTWDDEEETIINVTPKSRVIRYKPEASLNTEDSLGIGVPIPAPNSDEKSERGLVYVSETENIHQEALEPPYQPLAGTGKPQPQPHQHRLVEEPIYGAPAAPVDVKKSSIENTKSEALPNIDPPTIIDIPLPTKTEEPRAETPQPVKPKQEEIPTNLGTVTRELETIPRVQEQPLPPRQNKSKVPDFAILVITRTPSPRLHQFFRLDDPRMEIGRSFDTPIFLDDKTASLRHASIRYQEVEGKLEFVLRDLDSTNGTLINGIAIHSPTVLYDDDRILIGETELVFKKIGEPKTKTATP